MTVDFAIVGAGPAGMAAAALAAELGLDTMLIDEADAPGGQIYRAIERAPEASPLGADYLAGHRLAADLRASKARYLPATTVWHIDPAAPPVGMLSFSADGHSETVAARRILLATGAIERPVPIPGWTLPGVMTVGAAQILLKTAGFVPEGRAVLAGQGPLLYLAALQLARAGAPPALVLETTPRANYAAAVRHSGRLWAGRRDLGRGLALFFGLSRAGVAVHRGVRGLRALGRHRVERVAWDGGEIAADHLFLHEGVIPNTQISLALQLAHRWDEEQLCWRPVADDWGRTSLAAIAIAGDGAGIAGARAAALSGRLAALDAAAALGKIEEAERDRRARPIRADLARERAI
ncbi:MAG TPA: FAD-dependent oxidoreductase, partial [Stellaceae bacterium]